MARTVDNPGLRLPQSKVKEVRRLRQDGMTISDIAKATGVGRSTIGTIVRDMVKPTYVRQCALCGEDFFTTHNKHVFCCREHAGTASKYRAKGYDYSTFPHKPGRASAA